MTRKRHEHAAVVRAILETALLAFLLGGLFVAGLVRVLTR